MSELTFDEARHVYRLNGVVLPGVTSILGVIRKPFLEQWRGRLGNAEADRVMRDSADFGTRCHAAAEQIATCGIAAFEVLDADVRTFAETYDSWFNANVKRVLFCEARLVSTVHMVAGSVDLIAELMDDSVAAIDLKTGTSVDDVAALQLAAYGRMALEQHGIQTNRRLILHAPRKTPGELTAHEYPAETEPDDWRHFLMCLMLWRRFMQKPARPAPRQQVPS